MAPSRLALFELSGTSRTPIDVSDIDGRASESWPGFANPGE